MNMKCVLRECCPRFRIITEERERERTNVTKYS